MTPADIETIREAAAMLDGEALILRHGHCKPPEFTDWDGDIGAQESHDEMRSLVGRLYDVAERMERDSKRPDPLAQALNEGDGVYRP